MSEPLAELGTSLNETGSLQRIHNAHDANDIAPHDAVFKIKRQLSKLFVTALTRDTSESWNRLEAELQRIFAVRDCLQGEPEMMYYTKQVLLRHKHEPHIARVVDLLSQVLPGEYARAREYASKQAGNHVVLVPSVVQLGSLDERSEVTRPTPAQTNSPRRKGGKQKQLDPVVESARLSSEIFKWDPTMAANRIKSQPITVSDILNGVSAVAADCIATECEWPSSVGLTVLALNTDVEHSAVDQLPSVAEQLEVRFEPCPLEELPKESSRVAPTPLQTVSQVVLNGREAVEHFAKCYHKGQVELLYFNVAPRQARYRPYDLVPVYRKELVDRREHYIFSSFGVVHVQDGVAESLTLAQWQREAIVFEVVSQIAFFKNYLLRRAFDILRRNTRRAAFVRVRRYATQRAFLLVPQYCLAVRELGHVLYQMDCVALIVDLAAGSEPFMLRKLQLSQNQCMSDAYAALKLQYDVVYSIIGRTAGNLLRENRAAIEQLRKLGHFGMTRESLYLQRTMRERAEAAERQAAEKLALLGSFVIMVDRVIHSHAVCKIKRAVGDIHKFLAQLGECETARQAHSLEPSARKSKTLRTVALFRVDLCFALPDEVDSQNEANQNQNQSQSNDGSTRTQLVVAPGCDSFRTVLRGALRNMPAIFSQKHSEMWRHLQSNLEETADTESQSAAQQDEPAALTELAVQHVFVYKKPDEFVQALQFISHSLKLDLEGYLAGDRQYQDDLAALERNMVDSAADVQAYVESLRWVEPIQAAVQRWLRKHTPVRLAESFERELEQLKPFELELKAGEIRQWMDRVSLLPESYESKPLPIFSLNCAQVQNELTQDLSVLYDQFFVFIASHGRKVAQSLIQQLQESISRLRNNKTPGDFARFTACYTEHEQAKQKMGAYKALVDFIAGLSELLRVNRRQLSGDDSGNNETRVDQRVKSLWEEFILLIQEISEFVAVQSEVVYANVEHQFRKLEVRLKEIADALMSREEFEDAEADIKFVLSELRKLSTELYETEKKMRELAEAAKSLTSGATVFDLTLLNRVREVMEHKLACWHAYDTMRPYLEEWKRTPFRKMNFSRALEYLNEWQARMVALKKRQIDLQLPLSSDSMVNSVIEDLQDLMLTIALLNRLANPALKARHWTKIGAAIGEDPNAFQDYPLSDIFAIDIVQYQRQLEAIIDGAYYEHEIEERLSRMRKYWEEKEITLKQYVPQSWYLKERNRRVKSRPKSQLRRMRDERQQQTVDNGIKQSEIVAPFESPLGSRAQRGGIKVQPLTLLSADENRRLESRAQEARDDNPSVMYLLSEEEEIRYLAEDCKIALKTMENSVHLIAELKDDIQSWLSKLRSIEETIEFWLAAQQMWCFASTIFESSLGKIRFLETYRRFQSADVQFRHFVKSFANDPKVLALAANASDSPFHRPLQGAPLLTFLHDMGKLLQSIELDIISDVDTDRVRFPRLFFLSDHECAVLRNVHYDPKRLVPYIKKLFHAVTDVKFDLPPGKLTLIGLSNTSMSAPNDLVAALNEDARKSQAKLLAAELEPTTVYSFHGDSVQLRERVKTGTLMNNATFLQQFEGALKTSLMRDTEDVLHSADNLSALALSDYPLQIVTLVQLVRMTDKLRNVRRNRLQKLRKAVQNEIEQLQTTLRTHKEQLFTLGRNCSAAYSRKTLNLIESYLAVKGYERDCITSLMQVAKLAGENAAEQRSFDWMKLLRYRLESGLRLQKNTTKEMRVRVNSCTVQYLNASYKYDFEYHNPAEKLGDGPLLFTPMSDRMALCLFTALQAFRLACLRLPDEENSQHSLDSFVRLSQLLGRNYQLYNCSATGISTQVVSNVLSGALQSGSLVLFDRATQMDCSTLAQLASSIAHIRHHLHAFSQSGPLRLPRVREFECSLRPPPPRNQHHRRGSFSEAESASSNTDFTTRYKRPLFDQTVFFNNHFMKVSPLYGVACCAYETDLMKIEDQIPHALKEAWRDVSLVQHDADRMLEAQLQAAGFTTSSLLLHKFRCLHSALQDVQMFRTIVNVGVLKQISLIASSKLFNKLYRPFQRPSSADHSSFQFTVTDESAKQEPSPEEVEEYAFVYALQCVLLPRVRTSSEANRLRSTIRDVFGAFATQPSLMQHGAASTSSQRESILSSVLSQSQSQSQSRSSPKRRILSKARSSAMPVSVAQQLSTFSAWYNQELAVAVEQAMNSLNVQPTRTLVEKALELFYNLQHNFQKNVVVLGECGVGKTTMIRALHAALNSLHRQTNTRRASAHPRRSQETSAMRASPYVDLLARAEHSEANSNNSSKSQLSYPQIDVKTVCARAYSDAELFDSANGIVTRVLRTVGNVQNDVGVFMTQFYDQRTHKDILHCAPEAHCDFMQMWLHLDLAVGEQLEVDNWSDKFRCLLEQSRCTLRDGQQLQMKETSLLDSQFNRSNMIRMLIEAESLAELSPATVANSSLIYLPSEALSATGDVTPTKQWKYLFDCWLDSAKQQYLLTRQACYLLTEMARDLVTRAVEFARMHNLQPYAPCGSKADYLAGANETVLLTSILGALLGPHFSRQGGHSSALDLPTMNPADDQRSVSVSTQSDMLPHNYLPLVKHFFVYSFIWAFGSNVQLAQLAKFDVFVRDLLKSIANAVEIPANTDSVFDCYVDTRLGRFASWKEVSVSIHKLEGIKGDVLIMNAHTQAYNHLLDTLISTSQPLLLIGEAGVGKTALMKHLLSQKPRTFTNFTLAGDSPHAAAELQDKFEILQQFFSSRNGSAAVSGHHSAQRNRAGTLKHVVLVDDLHLSNKQQVPGLTLQENVRQLVTYRGAYSRTRASWLDLSDIALCACATVSCTTGPNHTLSKRMLRQFRTVTLYPPSDDQLSVVFSKQLASWIEPFPSVEVPNPAATLQALACSSVELYRFVKQTFLPVPSLELYYFHLHDLRRLVTSLSLFSAPSISVYNTLITQRAQIVQSSRLEFLHEDAPDVAPVTDRRRSVASKQDASSDKFPTGMTLIGRLWCHEACRTFRDRLQVNAVEADAEVDGYVGESCAAVKQFDSTLRTIFMKHFCSTLHTASKTTTPSAAQMQAGQMRPTKVSLAPIPESVLHEQRAQTVIKHPPVSEPASPSKRAAATTFFPPDRSPSVALRRTDASSTRTSEDDSESADVTEDSSERYTTETESDTDTETDTESVDLNLLQRLREKRAASGKSTTRKTPVMKEQVVKQDVPLMSAEQVARGQQSLSDFVFTRVPLSLGAPSGSPLGTSKSNTNAFVYTDVISRQLCSALLTVQYDDALAGSSRKDDSDEVATKALLCCSDTMQQVTRLLRALGGASQHALLVNTQYSDVDLSACAKLACRLLDYRYIEVPHYFEASSASAVQHYGHFVRAYLQFAATIGSLQNKQCAVLIRMPPLAAMRADHVFELLNAAYSVMQTGGADASFYTEQQLSFVHSQVLPPHILQQLVNRYDRVEQLMDAQFAKVRQNVHVIVCMQLCDLVAYQRLLGLFSSCKLFSLVNGTSVFRGSTGQPLKDAAFQIVRVCVTQSAQRAPTDFSLLTASREVSSLQILKQFGSSDPLFQERLCTMLAAFHRLAQQHTQQDGSLKQLVHLVRTFSHVLCKTERTLQFGIHRYSKSISRVDMMRAKRDNLQWQLDSTLLPNLQLLTAALDQVMAQIEGYKNTYKEARINCQLQEKLLLQLIDPLDKEQAKSKQELEKLEPLYEQAVHALQALTAADLEEIRSYRQPPQLVQLVTNAVCLLFGKPENWESAKLLLLTPTFFEDLQYFDKQNIADETFKRLQTVYIDTQMFKEPNVVHASRATRGLFIWVSAVHSYALVYRRMYPYIKAVLQHEGQVKKAQAEVGRLKLLAEHAKHELEVAYELMQERQAAVDQAREQIDIIKDRVERYNNLLRASEDYYHLWYKERAKLERARTTLMFDSLLRSALLTYCPPLSGNTRDSLFVQLGRTIDRVFKTGDFLRQELTEFLGSYVSTFPNTCTLNTDADAERLFPRIRLLLDEFDLDFLEDDVHLEVRLVQNRAIFLHHIAERAGESSRTHVPAVLIRDPHYTFKPWLLNTMKYTCTDLSQSISIDQAQPQGSRLALPRIGSSLKRDTERDTKTARNSAKSDKDTRRSHYSKHDIQQALRDLFDPAYVFGFEEQSQSQTSNSHATTQMSLGLSSITKMTDLYASTALDDSPRKLSLRSVFVNACDPHLDERLANEVGDQPLLLVVCVDSVLHARQLRSRCLRSLLKKQVPSLGTGDANGGSLMGVVFLTHANCMDKSVTHGNEELMALIAARCSCTINFALGRAAIVHSVLMDPFVQVHHPELLTVRKLVMFEKRKTLRSIERIRSDLVDQLLALENAQSEATLLASPSKMSSNTSLPATARSSSKNRLHAKSITNLDDSPMPTVTEQNTIDSGGEMNFDPQAVADLTQRFAKSTLDLKEFQERMVDVNAQIADFFRTSTQMHNYFVASRNLSTRLFVPLFFGCNTHEGGLNNNFRHGCVLHSLVQVDWNSALTLVSHTLSLLKRTSAVFADVESRVAEIEREVTRAVLNHLQRVMFEHEFYAVLFLLAAKRVQENVHSELFAELVAILNDASLTPHLNTEHSFNLDGALNTFAHNELLDQCRSGLWKRAVELAVKVFGSMLAPSKQYTTAFRSLLADNDREQAQKSVLFALPRGKQTFVLPEEYVRDWLAYDTEQHSKLRVVSLANQKDAIKALYEAREYDYVVLLVDADLLLPKLVLPELLQAISYLLQPDESGLPERHHFRMFFSVATSNSAQLACLPKQIQLSSVRLTCDLKAGLPQSVNSLLTSPAALDQVLACQIVATPRERPTSQALYARVCNALNALLHNQLVVASGTHWRPAVFLSVQQALDSNGVQPQTDEDAVRRALAHVHFWFTLSHSLLHDTRRIDVQSLQATLQDVFRQLRARSASSFRQLVAYLDALRDGAAGRGTSSTALHLFDRVLTRSDVPTAWPRIAPTQVLDESSDLTRLRQNMQLVAIRLSALLESPVMHKLDEDSFTTALTRLQHPLFDCLLLQCTAFRQELRGLANSLQELADTLDGRGSSPRPDTGLVHLPTEDELRRLESRASALNDALERLNSGLDDSGQARQAVRIDLVAVQHCLDTIVNSWLAECAATQHRPVTSLTYRASLLSLSDVDSNDLERSLGTNHLLLSGLLLRNAVWDQQASQLRPAQFAYELSSTNALVVKLTVEIADQQSATDMHETSEDLFPCDLYAEELCARRPPLMTFFIPCIEKLALQKCSAHIVAARSLANC